MPGNYTTDLVEDDIFAGAIYDRGAYLRGMGLGGPLNDSFGRAIVSHLLKDRPDFRPRRILDVGCSIGHSTLPFCAAYPEAEVHAIDLGAPMLRYGHARAEALGYTVHFLAAKRRSHRFPRQPFRSHRGHGDAARNLDQGDRRGAARKPSPSPPGGMLLHFEGPPWDRIGDFAAAVHDWDTHFNAEPFIGKMHDLDPKALIVDAGFKRKNYIDTHVPAGFEGTTGSIAGDIWLFGGVK